MLTTQHIHNNRAGTKQCGCCARDLPLRRLVELGATPGVYLCRRCALWAARRAHGPTPWPNLRSLLQRRPRDRGIPGSAVPILPSGDLDRTEHFFARLGFTTVGRYPGYLLAQHGPVELHFTEQEGRVLTGEDPDGNRLRFASPT